MSSQITVYVIGATGNTGTSIVDGLLEKQDNFRIIAAVRPSSSEKPAVAALRTRGVDVHLVDLASATFAELVNEFHGVDAVVSAIYPAELQLQKPLAKAAKEAGVTRFVPCDWVTACVRGEMRLYDTKAEIHDSIKETGVGYTFIDVGWWSQFIALFVDPSKSAYPQLTKNILAIWGTGDIKTAVADLRDIGRVVARILADERTLNRYVFFWAQEVCLNEAIALAEKILGKKLELPHLSNEELESRIQSAEGFMVFMYEYQRSLWIRGDNTIANAKRPEYGGALDARELYPDFEPIKLEQLMREFAAGLELRSEE